MAQRPPVIASGKEAYALSLGARVYDRLWAKIRVGEADGCWEWTAARNTEGYGVLGVAVRGTRRSLTFRAHRLVWVFTMGPIPDGACVRHSCDNPPCCNPRHLSLGTQAENMGDMVARDRQGHYPRAVGASQGSAKLDDDKVREIRRLYGHEGKTLREIAGLFGVHLSNVSLIVKRRTWKHVA